MDLSVFANKLFMYFHFLEALNNAFEVQFFSGLNFYSLSETLIACRAMQLRFLKEEPLFNRQCL